MSTQVSSPNDKVTSGIMSPRYPQEVRKLSIHGTNVKPAETPSQQPEMKHMPADLDQSTPRDELILQDHQLSDRELNEWANEEG